MMRRRKNRTFRVRASLDVRLIAAAQDNGRSVSEEIEYRLEASFVEADGRTHLIDLLTEPMALHREY